MQKLSQDHILCPYFEKYQNLTLCICPDGYIQRDNIICEKNKATISELVYSSNYTFTILVTILLIVVFIKTATSMKTDTKENTFTTLDSESNTNQHSPGDVRNSSASDFLHSSKKTEYKTCCFCWKYKKPSYQYRKRRRFIHLEQSLYVLGKTQAQAHV